jgi:hypothetical protein
MYVNYNKVTSYTKEQILELLSTNDVWVERALVVLYKRQTELEQRAKATLAIENERGFQVADALWFSRFAERIIARAQQGIAEGQRLTREELAYTRRPWARGKRVIPAIAKYRGQILAIIEANAKAQLNAGRI